MKPFMTSFPGSEILPEQWTNHLKSLTTRTLGKSSSWITATRFSRLVFALTVDLTKLSIIAQESILMMVWSGQDGYEIGVTYQGGRI